MVLDVRNLVVKANHFKRAPAGKGWVKCDV